MPNALPCPICPSLSESLRRLALNCTARLHARRQPATPEHPTWYTSRTPAKLHLLARLQSTSLPPITPLHRLLVDISHVLGSSRPHHRVALEPNGDHAHSPTSRPSPSSSHTTRRPSFSSIIPCNSFANHPPSPPQSPLNRVAGDASSSNRRPSPTAN